MKAFTICKHDANSLAGLELRESHLRLSDLCCHALLGHRRRPGDHSELFFLAVPPHFLNPLNILVKFA